MLTRTFAIAVLIAGVTGTAHAYDIGKLTCQNVGELAAHMLAARQSGVPPEEYLSALNETLPPDAKAERQLAVNLAKIVYQNDQVAAMQPEQAYAVFTQNCVAGQEQDRLSGQREEGGPGQDENDADEDGDQNHQ